MANIRNLVFSGGGVAAFAYGGAIETLVKQPGFSLSQIQRVIGTSAGSIAAFQVCANFTVPQMLANRQLFDCKKIADTHSFLQVGRNIFQFHSIYQGHELRKTILALMASAGLDKQSTFGDLKKKGFKDLYVTTTRIVRHEEKTEIKVKVFSAEEEKDTPILPVLLASSSIPGVFPAVKLKQITATCWQEDPDGESFVDGGCTDNFSLTYFDQAKFLSQADPLAQSAVNEETLGLRLSSAKEVANVEQLRAQIKKVQEDDIISLCLAALNYGLQPNYNYGANGYRTIFINRSGIKSTQFNISEEEKAKLHQAGSEAVIQKVAHEKNAISHHKTLSLFFRKSIEPLPVLVVKPDSGGLKL